MGEREELAAEMAESLKHLATILQNPEIVEILRKRLEVAEPEMMVCSSCCLLAGGGAERFLQAE